MKKSIVVKLTLAIFVIFGFIGCSVKTETNHYYEGTAKKVTDEK